MGRWVALVAVLVAFVPLAALADDSGPPRDVREVRADAMRLLAHRERGLGIEPKSIVISKVAVDGNQATVAWMTPGNRGNLTLVRHDDRWWDAAPSQTAGYEVRIKPAASDAANAPRISFLYARPPTHAEFLPNPPPPKDWGGSTDVGFFDFDVAGTEPVTFAAGTSVDIWFPFVLDDSLRYDVSYFSGEKAYGPYHGTLFDNVLHFDLPAFTVVPGKGFQAEISGWY